MLQSTSAYFVSEIEVEVGTKIAETSKELTATAFHATACFSHPHTSKRQKPHPWRQGNNMNSYCGRLRHFVEAENGANARKTFSPLTIRNSIKLSADVSGFIVSFVVNPQIRNSLLVIVTGSPVPDLTESIITRTRVSISLPGNGYVARSELVWIESANLAHILRSLWWCLVVNNWNNQ